jgi:Predicted thioesterase
MPAFTQEKRIRFQHCDPAGLLFYPKAFELVGEVIEDWFLDWSGQTPHDFHKAENRSLPTVRTACEFFDQVHVSDILTFSLLVTEIGKSSIQVTAHAIRDGKPCFAVHSTLVQVALDSGGRYRSLPLADEVRRRLGDYSDGALTELGASA